jgi:hypothetical protein
MRLNSQAFTAMFALVVIARELILGVLVGISVLALAIFIIITVASIGLL